MSRIRIKLTKAHIGRLTLGETIEFKASTGHEILVVMVDETAVDRVFQRARKLHRDVSKGMNEIFEEIKNGIKS